MTRNDLTIGIDCWFACFDKPRGIGRVTLEFLNTLIEESSPFSFVLFVPFQTDTIRRLSQQPNFQIIVTSRSYFIHEQICIPLNCRFGKFDILHSFANTSPLFLPKTCRRLINIHDLIFLEDSIITNIIQKKFGTVYRKIILKILKGTENIEVISPSEYVRDQILENKICDVVYHINNGFNLENYESKAEIQTDEIDNFILVLGALDPRKNTERMINAFILSDLNSDGVRLKVVGLQSITKFCRDIGLTRNQLDTLGIDLYEYLPDHELTSLYRNCLIFMYCSLNEGFGLPIIEAELHGARVLTSNSTSCAEVGGPNTCRVDPTDTENIAKGLHKIISNKSNDHQKSMDWATKYAWYNVIKEYFKVYGN